MLPLGHEIDVKFGFRLYCYTNKILKKKNRIFYQERRDLPGILMDFE